jgi:hypothetical protein
MILMTLVIGIFYLLQAYKERKKDADFFYSQFVKPILWISVGVICLLAYHLIANWEILGDPLAFIKNIATVNWSQWQWALNPNQIWKFRLFYPLVITYLNTPQTLGNITPLFVAFLPALLITGIRKKAQISNDLIILVLAAFITLLLWVIMIQTIFEIRYVFFVWIILFLPASVIIEKTLDGSDPFLQVSTKSLLIILLAFITVRIVYISIDSYSPVDREGNPHCYNFMFCDLLNPVNELAAPGDRVLSLNAFRYYLRTDLFACSTTFGEYTTLENLAHEDNIAFWTEVYREGYKFITYESNYSVWHLTLGMIPNPYNTPPWLTLQPIYGKPGDPEVAYQIHVKDPPVKVGLTCQKSISGVWELNQVQK